MKYCNDIINIAARNKATTKKELKNKFKKVVDNEKRRCYYIKVASERLDKTKRTLTFEQQCNPEDSK